MQSHAHRHETLRPALLSSNKPPVILSLNRRQPVIAMFRINMAEKSLMHCALDGFRKPLVQDSYFAPYLERTTTFST
ncbi:hypothetical protein VTK73DRAFT_6638 [Phialemonium thermophilum]|uniref:Uncharacterized protein n=1 Tax=Phialemonium thermophilum TaxID=223376 RepID=A0ABR3XWM1_9PEZI